MKDKAETKFGHGLIIFHRGGAIVHGREMAGELMERHLKSGRESDRLAALEWVARESLFLFVPEEVILDLSFSLARYLRSIVAQRALTGVIPLSLIRKWLRQNDPNYPYEKSVCLACGRWKMDRRMTALTGEDREIEFACEDCLPLEEEHP